MNKSIWVWSEHGRFPHIYIHTSYIHTYIHTYIRTYVNAYMHTFIHAYMHTFIHAYVHTCIDIVYIYIDIDFLVQEMDTLYK